MNSRPRHNKSRRPKSALTSKKTATSSRVWWIGGGLVVVVLVALIIASIAGSSGDTSGDGVAQVSSVELLGADLPEFTSTEDDPAVGTPAPGIEAAEFDDTPVTVDFGDGNSKVIVFFAHWCPHCQAELPRLTEWLDTHEVPAGVDIIAINTGVDEGAPNYPPSSWYEDVGWPEQVLRDSSDSAIARAYGLSGYPFVVVVDGEANVLARSSGELSAEQWEGLLELAAAGSTTATQ